MDGENHYILERRFLMKNFVLILLCFMLVGMSLISCSSTSNNEEQKKLEQVTVLLDWVPNTNHTGMYVALENGYYEQEGLEVEIIQANEGGTSQLIGADKGTFGISYQEEVTFAKEKEIPVKAIATILQHNTSGFASPSSKNIVTPKDFENKIYGGWGSPVEIATLKALMTKYNANFDTLEIATIGAIDFFAATESNVDFTWIYYGWDGIAAEQKGVDINYIDLGKENSNLDFYTPVIIASEKLIQSDPSLIKRFLEATKKGYEFSIHNPEAASEVLLKYAPELDKNLVLASQKWVANYYLEPNTPWGFMEDTRWDNYTEWLYTNNLIQSKVPSSVLFTNEFIPEQ